MSYLYTGPPIIPAKKSAGLGRYLADVCTVDPVSNARVCTSSDTIAPPPALVMAPPLILPPWPMPPTPAPLPITPCTTCGIKPMPPVRRRPIARPYGTGFGYRASAVTNRAPGAGRYMLSGMGDECQVYANGARVCNAAPPAPTPVPTRTNLRYPVWGGVPQRQTFMMPPATDAATPATPAIPYAPWGTYATPPATPYTTSTVAPVTTDTSTPAPVPIDTSAATVSTFDFSTIPTWMWIGGAVAAYLLFFRRR